MTMRIQVLAVVLLMLLAGCGGGDGNDEEPGPAGKKPLLGVTAGALLDAKAPLSDEMRVMADSGVTTLRAPLYWSQTQPFERMSDVPKGLRKAFREVGGRPTAFAGIDKLVAAAARERIALLPVVLGTPPWAARHPEQATSPPAGTEAYSAFLEALIGRYGPSGSFWEENGDLPKQPVRDWQIWNEPDHLRYWSDQPYAREYVRLARAARRAIKDADPGARVVMAGFADRSWQAIAAVYRAGGKGVFDVAAIHPYTLEVRNVLRIVRLARQELRRAGDGDRPMWLTEVTWSSGRRPGHKPYPFETTPPDQAARLTRALPLLLRKRGQLGIQRIYWESWIGHDQNHANPFDFSGLRVLEPGGEVREKPAFAAYKRVALAAEGR